MLAKLSQLQRICVSLSVLVIVFSGLSYFGTILSHIAAGSALIFLPLLWLGSSCCSRALLRVYAVTLVFSLIVQLTMFWVAEYMKCSCSSGSSIFLNNLLPMNLMCPAGYETSLRYASADIFAEFAVSMFLLLMSSQLKAKIENESFFT